MTGLSSDSTFRILHGLRVTSIAAQLTVIASAELLLSEAFRAWPLFAVTGGHLAWHVCLLRRRRAGGVAGAWRPTLEVAVDLVVVTLLLCFAGGWTNPFASVYLIPLGFAAGVLLLKNAVAMTLLAIAGYAMTTQLYVPLPHVAPLHDGGATMHLVGMALSFVLASVVLVATVGLVRRVHDGERRALAQEREARLRDEQLLSLGVLAASTAHELGTPLSTARLLVEDLQEAMPDREDLELLRMQLNYAVDRLHQLVRVADEQVEEDMRLDAFCSRIGERLGILKPEVTLRYQAELPAESIRYSRALESALLSLMINGATASARANRPSIEVVAGVAAGSLWLRIRDFGSGFHRNQVTDDGGSGGLGMGLVISSATLERFGGEARYIEREPGTEVAVTIPLQGLRVAAP